MQITSGRIPTAVKVVIYGPEGIGKTTFASRFPDPVFIDTEGSTVHMDVKRLPKPDLWNELLGEVEYVRQNPGCCKTLVIDTADWAEQLCALYVCARDQKQGIEDWGYGKGYKYLYEEFGRLLNALEQVRGAGVNVVICCHASIRKFEQPDELGAYDRWGLKLNDTPRASIAGMVKEWADMVLFANYKTIVVNVDGKGATKGKNKVQGGRRVMYTTHMPCWDAKNRFGLPDEMDFDYEGIRAVIEGTGARAPETGTPHPPAAQTPSAKGEGTENPSGLARRVEEAARGARKSVERAARAADGALRGAERPSGDAGTPLEAATPHPSPTATPSPQGEGTLSADVAVAAVMREQIANAGIPPETALARMMTEAGVYPGEVKAVIAQKGIYPEDTPWNVILDNAQFMQGWLLHPQVWPKVVEMAKANRDAEEAPF